MKKQLYEDDERMRGGQVSISLWLLFRLLLGNSFGEDIVCIESFQDILLRLWQNKTSQSKTCVTQQVEEGP